MISGEAIIDVVTCPDCGAAPEVGARRCPACGNTLRPRPASRVTRPVVHGLSSEELLAKIDALDREVGRSLPAAAPVVDGPPAAEVPAEMPGQPGRRWLRPVFGLGALAVVVLVVVLVVSGEPAPELAAAPPLPAPAAAPVVAAPVPVPVADPAAQLAAVQADEQRRVAKLAGAVRQAELAAERRAEERQAQAREQELIRLDQQFRERRRLAEAEALRAEREAAEGRPRPAAPAPAARRPASPVELCAAEGNLFARGLCENRSCATAEWRDHPYCIGRAEEQLRRLNQGG